MKYLEDLHTFVMTLGAAVMAGSVYISKIASMQAVAEPGTWVESQELESLFLDFEAKTRVALLAGFEAGIFREAK